MKGWLQGSHKVKKMTTSKTNDRIARLQAEIARLQAEQAQQQADEQQAKKDEHEFAEFVLSVVADRTGNKLAWSGEPIFLINAHANNTSFGGEVLEVLNGYSMQGIEYIAVNKYKRTGEYYASAIYLPCDFFIKNGELWINDIYKATGAVPHHYKKYNGTLTDGTQVSDLRTYDNSKKWQDEESKRLAKNKKLSEIATSK